MEAHAPVFLAVSHNPSPSDPNPYARKKRKTAPVCTEKTTEFLLTPQISSYTISSISFIERPTAQRCPEAAWNSTAVLSPCFRQLTFEIPTQTYPILSPWTDVLRSVPWIGKQRTFRGEFTTDGKVAKPEHGIAAR